MKRWLVILVLCVGCGSSNPVTPAPEDDFPAEMTFAHVSVPALEAYLAGVSDVFTSIDVFFTEYGGITAEAAGGLISTYWSRQYTLNMIARIHSIQAELHDMRPTSPYLLRLHMEELEGAFEDYLDGATFFEANIDFLTAEVLDGLNARMGAGNVHIIRLQIFLSDLAGAQVQFGSGGGPPDDGQGFGL